MESAAELPKKVYRVDLGAWFLSIIALIIFLAMICLLLWSMVSQPLSFLKGVQDVCFLALALFAFLLPLPYLNDRIEVSAEGIAYYGLGFQIFTPWTNLAGVGRVRHPNAFLPRPVGALLFRSPALLDIPIREGKRRGVAVIETRWLIFSRKPHTYTACLPLFVPESLARGNLAQHELALYLRQYAPWVFAEFVQNV